MPVKTRPTVAQRFRELTPDGAIDRLTAERDEARQIATHLMKHAVDCWSYQADLMEAYPWMREPTAAPTAPPGGLRRDEQGSLFS